MRFLKIAWYAAIWSKDLADKPVARTFLDEPVVLYRGKSGKAATPGSARIQPRCRRSCTLSVSSR